MTPRDVVVAGHDEGEHVVAAHGTAELANDAAEPDIGAHDAVEAVVAARDTTEVE